MNKPETEKLQWFVGCDSPRHGGRAFIGTTFGGHWFRLYPEDDLADAVRRHEFMEAISGQLNRAQGGGNDLEECRRHSCKRKAALREATPDAAPDAVTDGMVTAALDCQPLADENCAYRVWQMIGYDDAHQQKIMRAAIAAAIAHARSAGGEGRDE